METTVFTVQVQPGDCGPDGMVLVHNFTRWMDAATQHYFGERGVPPGYRMTDPRVRLYTQTLELQVRFNAPATHPDVLRFHTRIDECRAELFLQSHRVMRGDTLIGEGRETREFCCLDAEGRLRPMPLPSWLRSRCQ